MFDDTVCVKFEKDKEKFKKRAEELGYILFKDVTYNDDFGFVILLDDKRSLLNQRNYSIVTSDNYFLNEFVNISQEEFFGVTMLEQLDLRVLSVLVNLTCETLNSFSAYDVTSILRSRLPNFNIVHDDVRKLVAEYSKSNNLQVSDNGTYLTYTNPVKINFTPAYTSTTSNNSPVNTNNFTSKLQSLNTTQPVSKPKSKLETLLELKKQQKTVKLQSEGRINLTGLAREYFPGHKSLYVLKNPNKIVLSHNPTLNSCVLTIDPELRLRTGFKSSNVNINVLQGVVEITPC